VRKMFFNAAVFLTACLIVLNVCKLIELTIYCHVCGQPTYSENILERIACGFKSNFIHQNCAQELKYERKNRDASFSN